MRSKEHSNALDGEFRTILADRETLRNEVFRTTTDD